MKLFTLNDQGVTPGIEITIGEREHISGVPLSEGVINSVRGHLQRLLQQGPTGDRTVAGTRFLLDNVDLNVKNGGQIIATRSLADRRALLLVDVMPGVGGSVELKSGLLKEDVDDKTGEITRQPAEITESLGVLVVARTEGPFPTQLVMLQPGARIRVLRSGDTRDQNGENELPTELVVSWTGWTHPQVMSTYAARPPRSMSPRAFGMRVKTYA